MTEYEMASLANDYRDSMGTAAAMAFTTVSAFLVAGYLTAHKLNRFMTATVVTVYTLWLAGAVTNIVFIAINTDGLRRQMHLMAEQGQGLQWHLASSYSQSYVAAAVGVTLVVFAIIYLASVVFFFQSARQSRKAEAQA
jgi:hypothetical protein